MEKNTFYILSCGFAFFTLIFAFSFTQYAIRNPHNEIVSTLVERALQIHPFLTNKANFRKSQMNVTNNITKDYGKMDTWSIRKNKAKTNPKQTQFKANSKPIRTQFKPKQSQLIVSLSNLFQTPNLLIDRMKQNYLPVTLFPLTMVLAAKYHFLEKKPIERVWK